MCEINVKQTFQCEDALKLLLNILTLEGHKCWTYYRYGTYIIWYQIFISTVKKVKVMICPFLYL